MSFRSKIIEQSSYGTNFGLTTKFQSAYRATHSTETALLQVHDLLMYISGFWKLGDLLELSAAFDTIDHDTFFERLSTRMGIHGKVLG